MSTNVYTNYYPSNTVYLEEGNIQPFNQTPFIQWTPTKTIKNRGYYIRRLAKENMTRTTSTATFEEWYKHLKRHHTNTSIKELEDLLNTY